MRKVRIDLGVPIELRTKFVAPTAGEKHGKCCALGRILYPDVDGAKRKSDGSIDEADYMKKCGYLLYIKPAVFEDCPPDVRNYRTEHTSFPHDTTADQFFNESQFESYRALGRHAIGSICGDKTAVQPWRAPSVHAFFAKAWSYVHQEREETVGDSPVSSISSIVRWMQDSL